MTLFLYLLGALVLLDSFRLRGRAQAVRVVPTDPPGGEGPGHPPSGGDRGPPPVDSPAPDAADAADYVLLLGPGAVLTEPTRRAVSAYARQHGLKVLDLWPANTSPELLLGLLSLVDIAKFRGQRLARGVTAGQAMLVERGVLERADLAATPTETDDPVAFLKRAVTLKRFACTDYDFAVVPSMRAAREDPDKRFALARAAMGGMTGPLYAARVLWLAGIVAAGFFWPAPAGALLGLWMVRPVLALAGTALQSPRLFPYTALRPLFEVYGWLRTALGRWRPPGDAVPGQTASGLLPSGDPVEALRPVYAEMLADGLAPFFHPRRDDCPICGGRELRVFLRTGDLFQFKPGAFVLERCEACGHIFQNPQLTPRGLGFYYRDFYDGLDAEALESLLGAGPHVYDARAKMIIGHGEPECWLDVGGGSGHLCCISRDTWPRTRFESLDLSAGVEEAERRGWVDKAWRGLFPETAPRLARRYDVVSMSHYLEHTTDPRAEVAAAATVLKPGGLFLVEVPDPECAWGRWLGRFWLPWFQPQHLHLLSVRNLERLLAEKGFEPVVWHRGETHHPLDLFLSCSLLLNRLLPKPNRPWLPPAGPLRRFLHKAGWALGIFPLGLAIALDVLLAPLFRRPGGANTFRVLARLKG